MKARIKIYPPEDKNALIDNELFKNFGTKVVAVLPDGTEIELDGIINVDLNFLLGRIPSADLKVKILPMPQKFIDELREMEKLMIAKPASKETN